MQNRSLIRIFILNIVTLGLYELVWLSQTRQEMVNKFDVRIPSVRWVVLVRVYQIIVFFVFIALLFYFIPASNKVIDAIHRPSPECFISYTSHSDNPSIPVTDSCKNAIDNYFDNPIYNQQQKEVYTLIFCCVTGLLSLIPYTRWLNHYTAGVAKATDGKLSQTTAMSLLLLSPPTVGMVKTQSYFNEINGDL